MFQKDRQQWYWADWISSVFDKILNYGLFVLSLNTCTVVSCEMGPTMALVDKNKI